MNIYIDELLAEDSSFFW